ncbi:MAG TPA: HmuY family protein, partial [Turneriella sp.]|nr:HmuY family protein [Turneriella sp.]
SLLQVACADTLLTAEGFAGKPSGGATIAGTVSISLGGGLYETKLDATSDSAWVYFDFENPSGITVANPSTNNDWDIAFKRFMIKVNGGASGNANVQVVALNADNFASRTQAPSPFTPATNDVVDAGDGDDACRPTPAGVLFAFLNSTATPNACWFSYSIGHLTVRDMTYILRTYANKYYKIQIKAYYSETGTAAKYRFQWAEVTSP